MQVEWSTDTAFMYSFLDHTNDDGSESPFTHESRSCMERFESTHFNQALAQE